MSQRLSCNEESHIIEVTARDLALQEKNLERIRALKTTIDDEIGRRDTLAGAAGFHDQFCILCCNSFNLFLWAITCELCGKKVCKSCSETVGKSRKLLCCLCQKQRLLKQRNAEWQRLYPYSVNLFGYQKLIVIYPPNLISLDSVEKWIACLSLEGAIERKMAIRLDDANVAVYYPGSTIQLFHDKIKIAIQNLLRDVDSADQVTEMMQQHLAGLLSGLQQALCDIVENENEIRNEQKDPALWLSYECLLSAAILNQSIDTALTAKATAASSNSIAVQTEPKFLKPPDDSDLDEIASQAATCIAGRKQRRLLSLDIDCDVDSALDTDERESIYSSASRNWFFKEYSHLSPHDSLRSNRMWPSLRNLVSSSASPEVECNNEDKDWYSEEPQKKDTITLTTEDHNQIVRMDHSYYEVWSGDKAIIVADVATASNPDVRWYNGNKEISDKGRYRIYTNGNEHILEIYDTRVSDSGDIICLVTDDNTVTSAEAELVVKDQDIGGEEPLFIEPITSSMEDSCQSLLLQTKVTGYPEPRVTFFHERRSISTSQRHIIDAKEDGTWTLKILSATQNDTGIYTATAVNRFGKCSCKVFVDVLENRRPHGLQTHQTTPHRGNNDDRPTPSPRYKSKSAASRKMIL